MRAVQEVSLWQSLVKCRVLGKLALCGLIVMVWSAPQARAQPPFDFDTGNGAVEVAIPAVVPAILTDISPGAGDAPLVLRITTLTANAWFDAIAPYHPTMVGVYSRLGRRPASEGVTNRNRNIALLHATYRVYLSLFPHRAQEWRSMLTAVGLDPDNSSTDLTTPVGIGNVAGNSIVAARESDGMNQLGDEGGRIYHRQPYADYLGYEPVNTAYRLRNPSRWQPNLINRAFGLFAVQQFVTPQWSVTEPYSYNHPHAFKAPVPFASNHRHRQAYKAQADAVLEASANLTDDQKMKAEFFDNKLLSLGFSAFFASQSRGFSLEQYVQYDFLTNLAAFDAGIATWGEKVRYDAVRPFSAIHYLYENRAVTAWGGPGLGTVTDLPGEEWRGYLNTADHPEYPSGSACFCAAHSQSSRRFLGSDTLGFAWPVAQGSSVVEPGVTPATNLVLGPWNTWTEFETDCGLSRLWGGVHFMASIDEGRELCRPIGDLAYDFITDHINGTAP